MDPLRGRGRQLIEIVTATRAGRHQPAQPAPGWKGQLPGRHLALRLAAADGFTARRHH